MRLILAYALLSCNLAAIFCSSASIAARLSSSFSFGNNEHVYVSMSTLFKRAPFITMYGKKIWMTLIFICLPHNLQKICRIGNSSWTPPDYFLSCGASVLISQTTPWFFCFKVMSTSTEALISVGVLWLRLLEESIILGFLVWLALRS